ncbi:MAG: hypothetical protein AAF620_05345 [Bacteroidota bacterium]
MEAWYKSLKKSVGVCLILTITLISTYKACADTFKPARQIYYTTVSSWEDFLFFADELEVVLEEKSLFPKHFIWSLWLQTALASGSESFEALAQKHLLDLGLSEEKIKAFYRLDPRELTEAELAAFTFAQRGGVLPVKVNANDIWLLRQHYDEREIVNIMLLTSYAATFNVLYGTGLVNDSALNPPKPITEVDPQLFSLSQKKQENSSRFERRQFFESPILAANLTKPFLGMDWVVFNEHKFSVRESWEFFTIGQVASDCKHCQAHGALGMHYLGNDRKRIQQVYLFNEDSVFTEKERAGFEFMKHALQLPSKVNAEHIQALKEYYSETEIHHVLGVAVVTAFLSNYMQITAVVTDEESVEFAKEVIGPLGWHIGRHVGWPEEQRPMHPKTLFRLTWDGTILDKNKMFYSHAFTPVLLSYWGGKIIPIIFLILFEIIAGIIFLKKSSKVLAKL